ncbi:MAG: XRE family transcriptional regulator [Gammaproteobacteria bacterium]|nr:MAG: XRE family transcriptional regulator [Gammaproteobacteria bacterium]
MNKQVQIIEKDNKPEYAVVPYEVYVALLEKAEMAEDIAAFDQAVQELETGKDELVPGEVAKRLLEGESPIRIWREFRRISQMELARRAGISQAYVAQLESGRRQGGMRTLKAIARALNLDLEDLLL